MNRWLILLMLGSALAPACKGKAPQTSIPTAPKEPTVQALPPGGKAMPEHAVIVAFKYGLPDLTALREVEHGIEAAILKAGVGEYDGDEIAVSLADGFLYMYGPDADRLYAAIRPVLEAAPFMRGAVVTLRYGPNSDGVRKATATVGSGS